MEFQTTQARSNWPRYAIAVALGALVGVLVTLLLVKILMPGMMLVVHESRYGLDETCQKLQESITANGWSVSGFRNVNATVEKSGGRLERPVRIVELCKSEYASAILTPHPEISTFMPCALGVYEGDGGKTYIVGMNTGLLGAMFGGVIADVMGGSVSREEAAILKDIIR